MKTAPDPKDILEFQFKLLNNRRVAERRDVVPAACSLVTVDGKHGLIYVACNNKITVLKSGDDADKDWQIEHELSHTISRVAVNCDCSFVAVTLSHPSVYIYNAVSFVQQQLQLLREIKLSSAENVHIFDLAWNPCIPGMLSTVTSDSTVGSFSIANDKNATLTILEQLSGLEVLCMAWSPKGKQLVAGCKNGNLVQLKPDLKAARNITGPNPSIGSVINVLWITNYQFCAAYLDPQDLRINVLIVDAPKGEVNATFTCYDDITFGMPGVEGEECGPRYYFEHIPEWGAIIAASSGSSEVAVLGTRDNGSTWESWQLVDSGRAQLPLVRTSESYPVGLAIDKTSVRKLSWGGENLTLPHPVPILHILGTSGQLCSFHMVNLLPGASSICSAPTELVSASIPRPTGFVPSEVSFNAVTVASSTPQPKQVSPTPIIEQSKPVVATKLFSKTSTIPNSQPPADSNVSTLLTDEIESISKLDTKVLTFKETKPQDKISIDSNICMHAFEEESNLFERELRTRGAIQSTDIGTAAERTQLIENSEAINRFLIELRDTTASLTSDITYLKALLLQTFAWLEESKSKCSDASNNIHSRTDNNKLEDLRSLMYYLQSQLTEATRSLDLRWCEHVNKEKNRMKFPRLEFIYQNLLRHSQIIAKEKDIIQAQVKKWKMLTQGNNIATLNSAMGNMSVTTGDACNSTGAIGQRCRAIANRNCSFSREKQEKLKNVLKNTTTRVIEPACPSPIQDRLNATISSLTSLTPSKSATTQKPKIKPLPESQEPGSTITPVRETQTVKNPLASLDQIVASIGRVNEAPPNDTQNQLLSTNTISSSTSMTKLAQHDDKERIAMTSVAPSIISTGPPKPNTPVVSIPLFTAHRTPQSSSSVPNSNNPPSKAEVSLFATSASKPLVQTAAPLSTTIAPIIATPSVTPQSGPKTDFIPFNVPIPKSDERTMVKPTGLPPVILSTAPASTAVSTAPLQSNILSSFGFSSQPQASVIKTPTNIAERQTTAVAPISSTTKTTTPASSALESFSFAAKPANQTPFSFANKPTSVTSNAGQSLNLSMLGTDLQASTSTPATNINPVTTATNSLFSLAATSSPGSMFGGSSVVQKDKPVGTGLGIVSGSSIFGGSPASNKPPPAFGDISSNHVVKSSIFSGISGNSAPPVFDRSTGDDQNSIFGTKSISPPGTPGFPNHPTATATSVFGGISTNQNPASAYEANPTQLSNASVLRGNSTSIVSPFSGTNSSPNTSPFNAEPAVSTITSLFGGASTGPNKPSAFGGGVSNAAPISLFGGTPSSAPSTSLFGGSPSNNATASSIFGGISSSAAAPSLFAASSPTSTSHSIFGGALSSPTMGAIPPTSPAAGSGFGQAPTFGTKPGFGALGLGVSKPGLSTGFGAPAFFGTVMPSAGFGGFGGPPALGVQSPVMGDNSIQKVFGQASGSSTFEALAGQGGDLTFGNLAQKQPETQPPPAFSTDNSFTTWR